MSDDLLGRSSLSIVLSSVLSLLLEYVSKSSLSLVDYFKTSG